MAKHDTSRLLKWPPITPPSVENFDKKPKAKKKKKVREKERNKKITILSLSEPCEYALLRKYL